MITRTYYAMTLILAAAFLSACGGSTTSGARYTGSGKFIKPANATIEKQAAGTNLLTDSGTLAGWTPNSGFTIVKDPRHAGLMVAQFTGTGKAASADIYSPIINVSAGKPYTFSVWADPSQFTKGSPILIFVNPARNVGYGPQFQFKGAAGRFAAQVTIPRGVTQMRLDVSTAGGSIRAGQKFSVAQPWLRAGP